WQQLAESGNQAGKHLVIVGGGAAGAELAMAIAYQGRRRPDAGPRITLIAGEQGLLPDFGRRLRKLTSKALSRLDIERVNQRATGAGEALQLSCGQTLQADLIMAVTGAAPFDFLATSGLATDDKGFVLVNACHQSPSHPDVFAAGDACSRVDQSLNRSGVHSVRAGPVLAANLRAFLGGGSLSTFKPRTNTLYLIACGGKTATGSYGLLAFPGQWVWWLKDRIDRGFVAGFLRHRANQMSRRQSRAGRRTMQATDQAMQQAAEQLGQLLLQQGRTIATAESCTGGWVAKMLTDRAGSSAYLMAGLVTYSNEAKQAILGVSGTTL